MARCRCLAENCPCNLQPGEGITVSGEGSASDPWVVTAILTSVGPLINFTDTNEVAFTRSGAGSAVSPLNVQATLPWVETTGGDTGYVLTKQADGRYAPGPPTTAPIGAVAVGPGIVGDGSAGNPLRVNLCTYDDLAAACAP